LAGDSAKLLRSISKLFKMKKSIVLIGGTRGIGRAIAEQLHEQHSLYLLSRSGETIQNLQVKHLPFDVHNDSLDRSALPAKIDGLVYCPGSLNLKPFKLMDLATFKDDMDCNFFGLVKVVFALQDRLTNGANLIFFSTVAVQTGMPYHSSIASAKGAIEGFTRAMAAEYAPRVRVNAIAPSLVDTPLASRLLNSESKRAKMAERHPLKRVGNPKDIADLAVYLLTAENHWITGQVLRVDGGISTLHIN